jgi:hypothetical protein
VRKYVLPLITRRCQRDDPKPMRIISMMTSRPLGKHEPGVLPDPTRDSRAGKSIREAHEYLLKIQNVAKSR